MYHVPHAFATDEDTSFYEVSTRSRSVSPVDGPWPLVALRRSSSPERSLALYLGTMDYEQLAWEAFNPFEEPTDYLLLNRQEVIAFIEWLREQGATLSAKEDSSESMLTRLNQEGIASLGLHQHLYPEHRQSFFSQGYDPTAGNVRSPAGTVVVFSAKHPLPAYWLFVGYLSAAKSIPGADAKAPADAYDALEHLNLDKQGMEELARLLVDELPHLSVEQA